MSREDWRCTVALGFFAAAVGVFGFAVHAIEGRYTFDEWVDMTESRRFVEFWPWYLSIFGLLLVGVLIWPRDTP